MRASTLRSRLLLVQPLSFSIKRDFSRSFPDRQSTNPSNSNVHRNFYRTHGRALFKALTLAFLSYQFFYWAWLTLETESMKDEKSHEIKTLESEIRLLDEGRHSHTPGEMVRQHEKTASTKRLLEESKAPRG